MNNRLQSLLDILNEEPNDAFTIYAIALEYQNFDVLKSLKYYEILLEKCPEYMGTYYQYAKVLTILNKKEEAEIVYKKGIDLATQKRDFHALAELKQALNKLLGLDYED